MGTAVSVPTTLFARPDGGAALNVHGASMSPRLLLEGPGDRRA